MRDPEMAERMAFEAAWERLESDSDKDWSTMYEVWRSACEWVWQSDATLHCDFCGVSVQDPWHTSSATCKHLHECDECHTINGAAHAAIGELQNFVAAKRFDRDTFSDDAEFADWLLSRARHAIKSQQDAAIESKLSGNV